jgi:hypothetical protein
VPHVRRIPWPLLFPAVMNYLSHCDYMIRYTLRCIECGNRLVSIAYLPYARSFKLILRRTKWYRQNSRNIVTYEGANALLSLFSFLKVVSPLEIFRLKALPCLLGLAYFTHLILFGKLTLTNIFLLVQIFKCFIMLLLF